MTQLFALTRDTSPRLASDARPASAERRPWPAIPLPLPNERIGTRRRRGGPDRQTGRLLAGHPVQAAARALGQRHGERSPRRPVPGIRDRGGVPRTVVILAD